jgi:hypothetical protein
LQAITNMYLPPPKDIKVVYKDMWQYLKKTIKPYLTPTMLISFGIAWFITNGWCYLLIIIGKGWVRAVALAYAGFLYLPFTIEKPITIWIATRIQKLLFMKGIKRK